jgi:hypothetical protein
MCLYRHRFCLLTLLAFTLLCRGVVAQTSFASDTRLDRITTVEAEGIAMADLLSRLSEKTGIILKAHRSMEEKKVILFFRQQPLRDLLTGLATLFDASWQTIAGPNGTPTGYEILLGQKAQNRERELQRETIRRLASQVDVYVRALSLSPDELDQLPSESPLREFLSAPNQRQGIQLYSLLNVSQREILWTKRRLAIPFSALNERQQEAVAAIFHDETARLQAIADRVKDNPNIKIIVPKKEQLLRGSIQFRLRRLGGPLTLMLQMPGFSIQLARTDDTAVWLLPPHGDPYHPRHPTPSPPLPPPKAVAQSRDAAAELTGRLRALADSSSFAVLADFYRSRPTIRHLPREPVRSEQEAASDPIQALDDLCASSGYLWWSREKTLFFRKRDWYLQQVMEPPDSSILKIVQTMRSAKDPKAQELVSALASLTVEQIAGLNSLFTPLADEALLEGLSELLLVIASMSAQQQKQLLEEGLPVTVDILVSPPRIRRHAIAFLAVHAPAEASSRAPTLTVQIPALAPVHREKASHTRMEIHWNSGELNGVYRLFLPHSLPGDKSERLRVE